MVSMGFLPFSEARYINGILRGYAQSIQRAAGGSNEAGGNSWRGGLAYGLQQNRSTMHEALQAISGGRSLTWAAFACLNHVLNELSFLPTRMNAKCGKLIFASMEVEFMAESYLACLVAGPCIPVAVKLPGDRNQYLASVMHKPGDTLRSDLRDCHTVL